MTSIDRFDEQLREWQVSKQKQADLRSPYPWFGGKSRVADIVWAAIGTDVANYVEPFFGSGAVLLCRPKVSGLETINDLDGFIANFWRAAKADPDAVAMHADNPVNECDLHARHMWLVGQRERITDRLCGDPDYFDAKAAGWWVWGQCSWISGGWCTGKGPWQSVDGIMVKVEGGMGVNRKLPHISTSGMGVNRQLPHISGSGRGVHRKMPHDAGEEGMCQARADHLRGYIRGLADRLRSVRVCCGDWSRVCGKSVTYNQGVTGVFLDPPYDEKTGRDMQVYAVDSVGLSESSHKWAIEQGPNPKMRIVLAGYEGEHTMPADWRKIAWKAFGGYANIGNGNGKDNAKLERLWFSPHCIAPQ